jgi:hypothetical protein
VDNRLVVDTGVKRLLINDGPAFIEFNPSDVRWADKFQSMKRDVMQRVNNLKSRADAFSVESSHATTDDVVIEIEKKEIQLRDECCIYMRSCIDDLFGKGTSQKVFGDLHSEYAIASFLNGVTPYIQEVRDDKVSKYIQQPVQSKRKKHAVMK